MSFVDLDNVYIDTLTKENAYLLLHGTQESNGAKANLLGMNNIKILGYIGREYRWQHKITQIFFRTRLYLVKNRLYIVYVSTAKDSNFNTNISELPLP